MHKPHIYDIYNSSSGYRILLGGTGEGGKTFSLFRCTLFPLCGFQIVMTDYCSSTEDAHTDSLAILFLEWESSPPGSVTATLSIVTLQ